MKLLHIDSSVLGDNSVTRVLTQRLVSEWQAGHPGTVVQRLDLAIDAPSHLSMDSLGFRLGAGSPDLTETQRREKAVSEALVQQFLDADVVVIGAPMYNFAIPTQLKAWIDRIAQAGRTFEYTDKGPVGLSGGKTVLVALGRGGVYSNSEGGRAMEHQESYLSVLFGFLGVTDVRFVRAEGVAMGPEAKAKALAAADAEIKLLVAPAANQENVSLAA
jgi:FMN-dependent NADH-azoreductase